jgi:hypothetical protein
MRYLQDRLQLSSRCRISHIYPLWIWPDLLAVLTSQNWISYLPLMVYNRPILCNFFVTTLFALNRLEIAFIDRSDLTALPRPNLPSMIFDQIDARICQTDQPFGCPMSFCNGPILSTIFRHTFVCPCTHVIRINRPLPLPKLVSPIFALHHFWSASIDRSDLTQL